MPNPLDKMFEVPEDMIVSGEDIRNERLAYPPGTPSAPTGMPVAGGHQMQIFPFGMTSPPVSDTSDALGAVNNVVHACVERIISRAVGAKMYTADFNPIAKPVKPHWRQSKYQWYRQLYEQMLLTGNGLVWLDEDGNFNVGITDGSTYDVERGIWEIKIDHLGNRVQRAPMQGMIHFHMGRKEGLIPQKVPSPLEKVKKAITLYNETRELLTDYAANGHRLAGVFQATREVMDQNRLRNMIQDMKRAIEVKTSRYATIGSPNFLEYKPTGQVAHPRFEGIDIAIREISRVYGVPPELLGTTAYRSDYMNSDSHLLTEAVFPLLDSVCGTWSEALGIPVSYWPLSLHRPTLNSAAHTLMGLAQTGIMTINELRQLTGLSPLPDHDIMPMTAGAPERSEDRQKQGGNGARSNNSSHPGGGSAATDARKR